MGVLISNHLARALATRLGLPIIEACEVTPDNGEPLMICRHCIRYALGQCPKQTGHAPTWHEPLSLRSADGRCFTLKFDCARCEMHIH